MRASACPQRDSLYFRLLSGPVTLGFVLYVIGALFFCVFFRLPVLFVPVMLHLRLRLRLRLYSRLLCRFRPFFGLHARACLAIWHLAFMLQASIRPALFISRPYRCNSLVMPSVNILVLLPRSVRSPFRLSFHYGWSGVRPSALFYAACRGLLLFHLWSARFASGQVLLLRRAIRPGRPDIPIIHREALICFIEVSLIRCAAAVYPIFPHRSGRLLACANSL